MKSTTIKIAIADDHTAVRQALRHILSMQSNMTIIFEAENGVELISKLKQHNPDVLLLDIKMPGLDGIEALKIIHEEFPGTKTLILSAFFDEIYIAQSLEYGINGFLTKSMDIEEIVKAIQLAYRNEVYYSNLLNNALLRVYLVKSKKQMGSLLPVFSEDEIKILNLLKLEKNTEEISSIMHLSKRSIELKRDKMREKANVKTVSGLLLYALKRNLIE